MYGNPSEVLTDGEILDIGEIEKDDDTIFAINKYDMDVDMNQSEIEQGLNFHTISTSGRSG